MKILFCAYDRPGHIATGPNAWIQRLIPDLIHQYHIDVTMLFFHNGNVKDCPTIDYFIKNELPILTISLKKVSYTEDQVKQILQIIKKNSFTLLVANLVIPAFYAAKYLELYNIPVIPVLHSNDAPTKGVINKFINGNNTGMQKSVSVSNYINTQINDKNRDNHIVIPCGTPILNYTPQPYQDILKIIYAGRLEVEQKQIILLTEAFIEASKNNPKLEFSIYGNGSRQIQVEQIINTISNHKVKFKGAVKPSEIQFEMSKHNIFTLMSDYEGMPIALMEAMACGLVPVCLSELSGVNEIIEHGVNGFIVENRTSDYQLKLQILQKDHLLWQKMSENAIKTIKDKYSSDITHKKWAKLLLSFKSNYSKPITVPSKIVLDGEPLIYGDFRKPTFIIRSKIRAKQYWLRFRIFVRPRARIREILNTIKGQ